MDSAEFRSSTEGDPSPAPQPEALAARHERLARIRAMIDDGSYDTPERWEVALTRLLVDVGDC